MTRFEKWVKDTDMIVKAFEPILDKLLQFFDTLESYQKFELAHPRKKPRGSLRRARRKEKSNV